MYMKGKRGWLTGKMREGFQGRGTSNTGFVMMMPTDIEEDKVKLNGGLRWSREETETATMTLRKLLHVLGFSRRADVANRETSREP